MKLFRPVVIFVTLVITLTLQILLNSQGYNYLLYLMTVFVFCYFNEITYLEIGTLKIKKLQMEYEKALVALFKTQLQIQNGGLNLSQRITGKNGSYYCESGKEDGFISIVNAIDGMAKELKLSTDSKRDLNESIKKYSKIILDAQNKGITGKKDELPLEFKSRLSKFEYLATNGLDSLK